MKTNIFFKCIVVLFFLSVSCNKDTNPIVDYVIISGTLDNIGESTLKISASPDYSEVITITKSGDFRDTLYIENDGVFQLRESKRGKLNIYLSKGAEIEFKADGKDFLNTLMFTGTHAGLNNYFTYKATLDNNFMANMQSNFSTKEAEFEGLLKTFQDSLVQRLENSKDISEVIKTKELRAINYNRITKKILYPMYHAFVGKNKDFKTSEAFSKEIDTILPNHVDDYFHSPEYRSIIATMINKQALESKADNKTKLNTIDLLHTCAKIENETIRNAELFQNIYRRIIYDDNKEDVLNAFVSLSTDEDHIQKAKALYEKVSMLDAGKPSPKFENYENFDGSLTSLNDLKGNYIYIDVWATWCTPCMGEIPYLKVLEKEYHDKNIAFVSISVDNPKDKEKWKTTIQNKALDGIQLFADKSFNSEFIRDYKISSIPRFILIDPNGNIVDANANRPSQKEIKDLFDSILSERES